MISRLLLLIPAIGGIGLIVLFLAPAVNVLLQEPEEDPAPIAGEAGDGWLGRTFDRFRRYPFEDRALRLADAGDLEGALAALDGAGADADRPRIALMRADLAYRLGRHADARAHASAALEAAPDLRAARLLRALAAAAEGDHAQAWRDYAAALAADGAQGALTEGERRLARAGLVESGLAAGEAAAVAAAVRDFQPPPEAADWTRITAALAASGATDAATRLLEDRLAATEAPGERRTLLVALADVAQGAGDPAAARRRLEEASALGAAPALSRRLATLAELSGDLDAAVRHARDAAASDEADDLARLAMLQAKAGLAADAEATFVRLAERRALMPAEIEVRASGLAALGEPARAAALLESLPFAAALAERRATLIAAAGDPAGAAAALVAAADRLPADEQARRIDFLRAAAEHYRAAGAAADELSTRRAILALTGSDADRLALADREIGAGRARDAAETLGAGARRGDARYVGRYVDAVLAGYPPRDALRRLKALLAEPGPDGAARADIGARLATAAAAGGDWPLAAAELSRRATARPGDAAALDRALYALGQAGDAAGQRRLLERQAPFRRMAPRDRTRFALRLADLVAADAGPAASAAALSAALGDLDPPPEAALALAERYAAVGDCARALGAADRVAAMPDAPPRAFAIAGFCHLRQGDDAAARLAFAEAVARSDARAEAPPADVLAELGLLEAAAGDHVAAAQTFGRALDRSFDPALAVLAARSRRLSGDAVGARALLARARPEEIAAADRRALYWDEAATLAADDAVAARAALDRALAIEETPDRWRRLAAMDQASGRLDAAAAGYDRALALAPEDAQLHGDRAYVAVAAGDDETAAAHFERALALRSGMQLAEDAAYVHKRRGDNALAVQRFRDAVDQIERRLAALPGDDGTGERDALRQLQFDLRRETEEIEDRWTLSASLSFRAPDDTFGAVNPLQTNAFSGFAGVEAAYRPPVFGYWDGRTLEAFVRGFWNLEDESLRPDDDTRQLGVGLRVKPLADWNLVFSFERMAALGDAARNDWLARASVSFDQNLDWEPTRAWWPTGTLYVDAAHAIETEGTFLTATGRYGVSFRTAEGDAPWAHALMPYGLFEASHIREKTGKLRRLEVGVGVAWRHWFNETRYEAYRSTAEIAFEGRVPVAGNTGDKAGAVIRLSLRY